MLFPLLSKKHVLHTEAASIHSLLSYCWGSGTLHIKRHLGAAKHPPLQSFYNLVFTSSLLPLHFPPPIFSNLHSSLLINTPPSFFFFFDPLELRGFLHLLILQCALIFIWVTVRFFLIFVSLAFHSLSSQTFSSSSLHIFLSICLSSPHPFSLVYPLSLSLGLFPPSGLPLFPSLSLYLCLVVKWWLTGGVQPRIWRAHRHTCIAISQEYRMQATCCTYCAHMHTQKALLRAKGMRGGLETHSHTGAMLCQPSEKQQTALSHITGAETSKEGTNTHTVSILIPSNDAQLLCGSLPPIQIFVCFQIGMNNIIFNINNIII